MSKKIRLLYSEQDREALKPLLDELRLRGLRIEEAQGAVKGGVVLAVLSQNFYADEDRKDELLGIVASGTENVLPLQLDSCPVPDALKNAIYARNIIPASGRDAAHTAERILDALPKKKSRLPLIILIAGIVLLAAVGLLIRQPAQVPEEPAPVEEEVPAEIYDLPEGWTQEDLDKIADVIIVGEQVSFYTYNDLVNGYQLPDWDYFAYREYDENGPHWYSREDGHEYRLTRYDDLRFLELLPNLRFLTLALVDAGQLPELAGLTKLDHLMLMDSVIPDLEWIRGSSFTNGSINNTTGSITDFSPLTSCEKLTRINLDLDGNTQADLAGFAPSSLIVLQIVNGHNLRGGLDLSGLSACTMLRDCELSRLPVTDLSFLRGISGLEVLNLGDLRELRDISALGELSRLKHIIIDSCDRISDLSPIAGCSALESYQYHTEEAHVLRDMSFLAGLTRLNDISLQNVTLADVDFLLGIAEHQSILDLDLAGTYGDYSALESVKTYKRLNLDPSDDTPLEQILPYLEGASIQNLCLRRFLKVDLSILPEVSVRVELDRCGIEDLTTLPEDWKVPCLVLNKCNSLRSLDGLQNQSAIRELDLFLCMRMTGWNALEGQELDSLSITGGFTVPEGIRFKTGTLRIESVEDVADLGFLETLDAADACSFALVGLDDLNNLQPLDRFHGDVLAVSPQLAEQADDLVKAGNFREYRIEYPQGGWEEEDFEFELLSMDELDTLPKALLRRVTRLCLIGDTVISLNGSEIGEDWEDGSDMPALQLENYSTGETVPIEYSVGPLQDMSRLSALTGLRELFLYAQPLASLDGIQMLSELEVLAVCFCPELSDASAAFALPNLRDLNLRYTGADSIQGVQNLSCLSRLDISNTPVSDLSPLAGADLSEAESNGGFSLNAEQLQSCEDFSALASVRRYRNLNLGGTDAGLWIDSLAGSEIEWFCAYDAFKNDEDMTAFLSAHPEIREMHLPGNREVTDLSPLLNMKDLHYVKVSADMEQAIASLGEDVPFELQVND